MKTLRELKKCKKPGKGEKTNTIFEIRTDLAVAILGNEISVSGKKKLEKEICRHLEASKLKSK